MANGDVIVETHIKVTDDLGAALVKDGRLIDDLGGKLDKLGEHMTNLASLAGRLSADGGFAKLTNALNPSSLFSELEQIKSKIGDFRAVVQSIGMMSDEVVRNGVKLTAPLDAAINQARPDVRGLKTRKGIGASTAEKREQRSAALAAPSAATPAGAPPEKPVSAIDGAGKFIAENRARIGTLQTIASPATTIIHEADAVERQLIQSELKGEISKDAVEPLIKAMQQAQQATQLPPVAEAQILSMLAEKFGKDPATLTKLLPIFSNFADAQMLMKGTSYDESTKNLLALVNNTNIKDPDKIGSLAQLLNGASLTTADSTASLVQMVGGSIGAMGKMSPKDVVLADILASRAGAAGDLTQVLTRVVSYIGSGAPNDKTLETLQQIGLVDSDKNSTAMKDGHVDFPQFLQRIGDFEARIRAETPDDPNLAEHKIAATLQTAFGTNAALVHSLASPDTVGSAKELAQQVDRVSIEDVQKRFDEGSVERQLDKAKASLETTLVQLGRDVLPVVNQQLQKFNEYIVKFNNWMGDHKEVAKDAGLATVFGGLGLSALFAGSRLGLARFATNPWVLGGLAAAGVVYEGMQQARDLDEKMPSLPGETEYQRQMRILNLTSGDGVRIPTFKFHDDSGPARNPLPPAPPRPQAPPRSQPSGPAWWEFSITPDNFTPAAFTMPSDRRGPTRERAVAHSDADILGKSPPVNVQVQPGHVVVQLDGHAIATAVIEFMARQVGGPNTGPVSHDPFQSHTPAGSQLSYLT